jgi:ATP-dependent Lhr-like helicase
VALRGVRVENEALRQELATLQVLQQQQQATVQRSEELRRLLDPEAIREVESLRRTDARPIEDADALHDLLRRLGPQSKAELLRRGVASAELSAWLEQLTEEARVPDRASIRASEDVARCAMRQIEPPPSRRRRCSSGARPPRSGLRFARTHDLSRSNELPRLGAFPNK